MTANGNGFYFDYKDGKYGYNTDPNRGADTFHPFKSDLNIQTRGATVGNQNYPNCPPSINISLSGIENYKDLVLYRNIFPVCTNASVASWSGHEEFRILKPTYNYNRINGNLQVSIAESDAMIQWADITIYIVTN